MMEFVVDWNAVCLVCLQEGDMRSIYEKDERDLTHCEKIMHCSSIEIKGGMNLPEQICISCLKDLNAAYRFRTNCESSNVILKSFIDSRITDVEIPSANGQVYKYKPPSGLNVKRIKCPPKTEVKEEHIIDDSAAYQTDDPSEQADTRDPYENSLDVDVFQDEECEEQIYSPKIVEEDKEDCEDSQIKLINDAEVVVEYSLETPPTLKTVLEPEAAPKPKATKRGRPRARLDKQKLQTEVTADNVSNMVSTLTTVAYVRKAPEDGKPLKICEICGNGYKYQHALDSHMRRHRNEKPFSCEFCDRAFVANVELRRHMRVHTGHKPYACRYCERRFSDFGSRIKHERTHTGERPYECTTCGKAFAYAHVLSVHVLTHTGEKRFKCQVCGKGFTKKAYLLSHSNHHVNTPYMSENPLKLQSTETLDATQGSIILVKQEGEQDISMDIDQQANEQVTIVEY